jgi:RNA-binding protein
MRRYGSRTLIVSCDAANLPRLYSEVVDRRMKPVGRVVDVFGNVTMPYAAIQCRNRCDTEIGENVFVK